MNATTRHTVTTHAGDLSRVATEHTRPGAAYRVSVEARELIAAFAMRDTRAGWAFATLADRVADDIASGVVVGADLSFCGAPLSYRAPTLARAQRVTA